MHSAITPKQKKVLEIIYHCIATEGFPPSLADLRAALNVSSNQSVLNFLEALERNGYIKREEGQARSIKILPLGLRVLGKKKLIPVAGASSCGPYVESFEEVFVKWETLRNEVMENERIDELQEEVFIIKVYGDSMINAGIDDGDMLLVKKTKEYKSGDIVVARYEDGTTVKRFVAENKKTYLKPENPNYKNIPIYPEMCFEGKVILNLSKTR